MIEAGYFFGCLVSSTVAPLITRRHASLSLRGCYSTRNGRSVACTGDRVGRVVELKLDETGRGWPRKSAVKHRERLNPATAVPIGPQIETVLASGCVPRISPPRWEKDKRERRYEIWIRLGEVILSARVFGGIFRGNFPPRSGFGRSK